MKTWKSTTVWLSLALGIALPALGLLPAGEVSASGYRLESIEPTDISSLTIEGNLEKDENGVLITHAREIILLATFEALPPPTHYSACEDEQFTDCEWKRLPFDGRLAFTLSEGAGLKKIYLRAKLFKKIGKPATILVKYVPQ